MRKISPSVLKELLAEPNTCLRADEGNCDGRITFEHALTYAGRQIDEVWAILRICEFHHGVNKHQDGGDMNKEKHMWLALNRATGEELIKYSKAIDYIALREKLNKIYGN